MKGSTSAGFSQLTSSKLLGSCVVKSSNPLGDWLAINLALVLYLTALNYFVPYYCESAYSRIEPVNILVCLDSLASIRWIFSPILSD